MTIAGRTDAICELSGPQAGLAARIARCPGQACKRSCQAVDIGGGNLVLSWC